MKSRMFPICNLFIILLCTLSIYANALPLSKSEPRLIAEFSNDNFRPCLSKFAGLSCPDSFTINGNGKSVDINIKALNGDFRNVILTTADGGIFLDAYTNVSPFPAVCPLVKENQVCTFTITNAAPPRDGLGHHFG